MAREGEGAQNDERWKDRTEFMQYLATRGIDADYPKPIREKALELYSELIKYSKLPLSKKATETIRGSFAREHFDTISQLISDLRQTLIASNLGDSEFTRILAIVHDNIKS